MKLILKNIGQDKIRVLFQLFRSYGYNSIIRYRKRQDKGLNCLWNRLYSIVSACKTIPTPRISQTRNLCSHLQRCHDEHIFIVFLKCCYRMFSAATQLNVYISLLTRLAWTIAEFEKIFSTWTSERSNVLVRTETYRFVTTYQKADRNTAWAMLIVQT